MTRNLAPGSPPLVTGDKAPVEPISDSEWEDLPDGAGQDQQDNLKKIARAKKGQKK